MGFNATMLLQKLKIIDIRIFTLMKNKLIKNNTKQKLSCQWYPMDNCYILASAFVYFFCIFLHGDYWQPKNSFT